MEILVPGYGVQLVDLQSGRLERGGMVLLARQAVAEAATEAAHGGGQTESDQEEENTDNSEEDWSEEEWSEENNGEEDWSEEEWSEEEWSDEEG
jgi:hypothetical protein